MDCFCELNDLRRDDAMVIERNYGDVEIGGAEGDKSIFLRGFK